jgi:hypothetical protein
VYSPTSISESSSVFSLLGVVRSLSPARSVPDRAINMRDEKMEGEELALADWVGMLCLICLVKRVKTYDPHGDVRMVDP